MKVLDSNTTGFTRIVIFAVWWRCYLSNHIMDWEKGWIGKMTKISDTHDIDLHVTFLNLNFWTSPISNCLVNPITPGELPTISREVLQKIIYDEFDVNIGLQPVEIFKQAQGHMSYEQDNTSGIVSIKF